LKNQLSHLEDNLLPWLSRVLKSYSKVVMDEFDEQNIKISRDQYIVLRKLSEEDGQMQNDLALATDRDKTSLTRLLITMERKNFIVRNPCAFDKRVKKVFITDIGKKTIKNCLPILKRIADSSEEDIEKTEIENAIKTLKKVHLNLIHQYEQ
jgi:DNA-binding MarR family transcriptional regulator